MDFRRREDTLLAPDKRTLILEEAGENVLSFVESYADLDAPSVHVLKITDKFNLETLKDHRARVINLNKCNDIRELNQFFRVANRKVRGGGLFIGCVETLEGRRRRLLKKFWWGFNYVYYFFDFIFKRICPKLPVTRKIYFWITAKRNHAISKAEVLGRITYCGFKVKEIAEINNLLYFVAERVDEPSTKQEPSSGMILRLTRVGYKGKLISVYKFRTMHPYAEYIQQYLYVTNDLKHGGKFLDDFRVTSWGRFMRRMWIDEIPMIVNLFRGQLKIVGVRPLSQQYLSLYPEELRKKRQQTRPGLIPPFYADLPGTLEEIAASEMRYLKAREKGRFRTDVRYFFLAFKNIIFKGARSS